MLLSSRKHSASASGSERWGKYKCVTVSGGWGGVLVGWGGVGVVGYNKTSVSPRFVLKKRPLIKNGK